MKSKNIFNKSKKIYKTQLDFNNFKLSVPYGKLRQNQVFSLKDKNNYQYSLPSWIHNDQLRSRSVPVLPINPKNNGSHLFINSNHRQNNHLNICKKVNSKYFIQNI